MREFGVLNALLETLDFSDHWSEIAILANQYGCIELVVESIGQHMGGDLDIDPLLSPIPNPVRVTASWALLITRPINNTPEMDGEIG